MTATSGRAARPLDWRHAIYPYALLILANFFWASNWIVGRGIHEAFPPVALSFYRWLVAGLILAPIALPRLRGKWHLVREHWRLFLFLGGTGVATFQAIIYVGLNYTTAVNATILNAATPLLMVLTVWGMEGTAATRRQWFGMIVTVLGVVLIVSRGDWRNLATLHFNTGDIIILVTLPIWCFYSILLKRRPMAIDNVGFTFVLTLIGLSTLSPFFAFEEIFVRTPVWSGGMVAAVIYVALTASIAGYLFWNRGVELIGANAAGFTYPFQPAFAALLAVIVLGEPFRLYNGLGFAVILVGWLLTTGLRAAPR
ncbi:MAG TPA: DMT family transporter [Stellaceae bacterium]|nr:DMT family transporter [Stellaceae bacterium]